jgi:putative hydrolase of the HAD superfamily
VIAESFPEPVSPLELIGRLRGHGEPLAPIPTKRKARIAEQPGIRAVLFDVYGTMFVSASGDIASGDRRARSRALGSALEAMGIRVDRPTAERAAEVLVETVEAMHRRSRDRGVEFPEVDIRDVFGELLEHLNSRGAGVRRRDRSFCEALAVEYECRCNPTWPMPGLARTLHRLNDAGIALGIVSNAQFFTPLLFPAYLDEIPENLGFDPDLCVWSYRLLEAKPSRELFRRALVPLGRRGVTPQEVLYVGNDRVNDVWPAAREGMKTALFAGDGRSFRPREGDPRIEGVREDLLLTNLEKLPDSLGIA